MYNNLDIHQTADYIQKALRAYKFQSDTMVNVKSVNDFVTSVDIDLQEILFTKLPHILDVPILSEESQLSNGVSPETYWIIDPLDGTSNYISGLYYTASSIALVHENHVIFGLVYDYYGKNFYYAGFGFGAFKNGIKLNSVRENVAKPSLIGVSTGLIKKYNFLDEYELFNSINFRILGSQALQLCLVAEGRLLGNLSVEAKIWDDAAGLLLIGETGGSYTSTALQHKSMYACMVSGTNLYSCAIGMQSEAQKFEKIMEALS